MKYLNKTSCIIDESVKLGKNVTIYPNNMILGDTVIGDGCILYPNNYINNSKIGKNCEIKASFIEDGEIGDRVNVGPFANLREKNVIGCNCRIGDFVELKNCKMGKGTKASHHSYLGDVVIGENCNIGAGVIVANYDGTKKYSSTIGDGVFIGCNCNIISPVVIADKTYICAGTTLTKSTKEGDFVIGRVRETIKPQTTK